MKNEETMHTKDTLPDADQVCDMILKLQAPIQLMAWIMTETALRLSDIQSLKINSYLRVRREIRVGNHDDAHLVHLSSGLSEALDQYLYGLRMEFEKTKRRHVKPLNNHKREVVLFHELLMFPSWVLPEQTRASIMEPVSSSSFVCALQSAAREGTYQGRLHSNTLRHCCTVRWLAQGLTVTEIHQKLGHCDLMTTLMLLQALRFGELTYTTETSLEVPMKIAC